MAIIEKTGRASNDQSFARIGYENLLVSASSPNVAAVLIPNTYERFISETGNSTFVCSTSAPTELNYIAIGAHNIGSVGGTITVKVANGGSGYTTVGSATPTDNKALFFEFETTLADNVQVVLSGGPGDTEIGVVYAGRTLIMQQAIYGGHTPINLSSMTEYRNSMSSTGQFLGRKVRRKGIQTSFAWQNLTDDWYRSDFQPFVQSAKTKPFFIKWRPDYFSDEVAFGYSTGDMAPTNQAGTVRLVSVELNMRAHDE